MSIFIRISSNQAIRPLFRRVENVRFHTNLRSPLSAACLSHEFAIILSSSKAGVKPWFPRPNVNFPMRIWRRTL